MPFRIPAECLSESVRLSVQSSSITSLRIVIKPDSGDFNGKSIKLLQVCQIRGFCHGVVEVVHVFKIQTVQEECREWLKWESSNKKMFYVEIYP